MEKLKGKGLVKQDSASGGGEEHAPQSSTAPPPEIPVNNALQLPVDVYQTDKEIIIFAQVAGIDLDTIDVAIEGENDVISISGHTMRPEELIGGNSEGDFSLEECSWGEFYRQIILPDPIEPEEAEAKEKDGVLVLTLPLQGHHKNAFRMNVVRVE